MEEVLILKENNSFKYMLKGELINQTSAGNWVIREDKLILNSYSEFESGIMEVTEMTHPHEYIKFTIRTGNLEPLSFASITFDSDGVRGVNTDENGIAKVKKLNFSRFTVHYLGEDFHYKILDTSSNEFKIEIKPNDLSQVYFENFELKIFRNRLVSPNGKVFRKN